MDGVNRNRIEKWNTEPDQVDLEAQGMHLLIRRHPALLILMGYVGVDESHPFFGKDYDDADIRCHWGLSFSGNRLSGMKKEYWYFGFDCAHCDDYAPGLMPGIAGSEEEFQAMQSLHDSFARLFEAIGMPAEEFSAMGSYDASQYKDMQYVLAEACSVFEQLQEAKVDSAISANAKAANRIKDAM